MKGKGKRNQKQAKDKEEKQPLNQEAQPSPEQPPETHEHTQPQSQSQSQSQETKAEAKTEGPASNPPEQDQKTPPKEEKSESKEEKKEEAKKEGGSAPQAAAEPQSQFSMIKYMCLAFVAMQVLGSVYQFYTLFNPPLEIHTADSQDKYINFLRNSQPFNISIFYLDGDSAEPKAIATYPKLYYNFSAEYPITKVLELPVTSKMRDNETVYLVATLTLPNFYKNVHRDKSLPSKEGRKGGHRYEEEEEGTGHQRRARGSGRVESRVLTFRSNKMPLIRYERSFEIVERSLVGSDTGMESGFKGNDDPTIYAHFKSMLYAMLVHDTHGYVEGEFEGRQMPEYVREKEELYYHPLFYLNDFWTMKKHLVRLNESLSTVNLTLHFSLISPGRHIMSKAFKMYEAYPDMLEEFKEILSETNVYLLAVTLIVTLLHTVLDMLSVKNDIQFWMNNRSFKGISVKTVFVQVLFDVIIFLYIWDSSTQSSTYILLMMGVSILLDMWKITRVCKFSLESAFPYVKITYQQEYTESNTHNYDSTAIKFMSYLLFPLFLAYSVYSFMYKKHKGYYSYVVNTLASGVYLFGFILMTPQLYINYKLKSVAHLPWRALFYKFLNTIIDDLFSFVIKMPVMHRIACFRDDVIFIIYIYQRYIYKVDPKRNEEAERQ